MSLYTCPDYAAIESQQDASRYSDMLDAAEAADRQAVQTMLDWCLNGQGFAELEVGAYAEDEEPINHLLMLAADRQRGGSVEDAALARAAMSLLNVVMDSRREWVRGRA